MENLSRSRVDASRQRRGLPTGTGMMCDCEDIIGISASLSARRVFSTCSRWAIRSATARFRSAMLRLAPGAAGSVKTDGVTLVKVGARPEFRRQITDLPYRGDIAIHRVQ